MNNKASFLLRTGLLLSLIGFGVEVHAQKQKKKELEEEKKNNLQKIEQLNKQLDFTKQKKGTSLNQLNILNEKIETQGKQINIITKKQDILNSEMEFLGKVEKNLSGDIDNLKEEYTKMIYLANKSSNTKEKLLFLFSAEDLNQFFRRYKYLEQYAGARRKQVEAIEKLRAKLLKHQKNILAKKKEQIAILREKIEETQALEKLKADQDEVIVDLSKKEKELKQRLSENKKVISRLEKMIADIVKREIKKSQERAKKRLKKTVVTDNKSIILDEEENILATSFSSLHQKMSYPVEDGFISDRFGVHRHSVLKGVFIRNDGVNIQAKAGSEVKVVYDGIIQSITPIQGVDMVVFVQHGNYFTVYSKLDKVSVKVGQKISRGTKIGEVAQDSDGIGEINFQIWKNTKKENPENWLKKH